MVLKPDPIFRALDAIEAGRGRPLTVVLTSPQGTRFTQAVAQRLARPRAAGADVSPVSPVSPVSYVLLCGRYEGFDERIPEPGTEELSIGDSLLPRARLPAPAV